MVRTFARVAGWLFLLLGILGFFVTDLLGLIQFDSTHNIIHLVLGLVGIAAGQSDNAAKWFAKVFGVIYLLLGIVGFFFPMLAGLHLEVTENLVHLVVGAWGVYVGFGKTSTEA
ncbi:DUF4383 domain-containing protein [Tumebacillus permanentifrigoris]|uniref:Uncharacterized protein DUF4383 n=1 Tax=Tumebacillus permanentifrigoris TaxID=378543 RepID=A0A316D9N2_9BACL|nr:DUF4383 domain-containing protein [Tumebacillus permanentifrigoris]PWK13901.1 uncharacterized protein DUF4383 [Tumebacillus permanentifrigoris]